jgi:hypothetical protein
VTISPIFHTDGTVLLSTDGHDAGFLIFLHTFECSTLIFSKLQTNPQDSAISRLKMGQGTSYAKKEQKMTKWLKDPKLRQEFVKHASIQPIVRDSVIAIWFSVNLIPAVGSDSGIRGRGNFDFSCVFCRSLICLLQKAEICRKEFDEKIRFAEERASQAECRVSEVRLQAESITAAQERITELLERNRAVEQEKDDLFSHVQSAAVLFFF